MARGDSLLSPLAPTWLPATGRGLAASLHVVLPALGVTLGGLGLARHARLPVDPAGLVLLASGALFAYLHDRLAPSRRALDRRSNARRCDWLAEADRPLAGLALAAGALGLAAFVVAAPPIRATALALGLVALAYPALARLPLGKTLAVAASWTAGAALLPGGGHAEALRRPETGALFFVVAAAAVLCDLKDREADREARVRSLPALAGARVAAASAAVLAAAGGLLGAMAGCRGLAFAAVGLIGLAAQPRWIERELSGPLLVDACLAAGLAALLPG